MTAGDSAGVPWSGRTLTAQPFAGDDGLADPALAAALERRRAGGDLAPVVAAWAPSRVLVPVVAVLGEGEELAPADGDKSADMALATLVDPGGRRALPAFTSVAALAAWDAGARPVPAEAARAAQAAVAEGCDAVVLDPAGPVPCVLPRPAVWAVAQGRDWAPPAADPDVLAAVAAAVAAAPEVTAHRCEPAGDAGLELVLALPPGLGEDRVSEVTARLGEALAAAPVVAERVASVRLRLTRSN